MIYTAILSPQPDPAHGYAVVIPSLPGVVSQGETRAEALTNAVDAARLWIKDALAHSEPIPPDDPDSVAAGVRDVIEDREAEGWPIAMELTPVDIPVSAVQAA